MTTLLLVNLDRSARALAAEASRLAFAEAECVDVADASALLEREPSSQPEIVIMQEPETRDLALVTSANDASSLQRWPVVVVGEDWAEEWAEVVPAGSDPRLLAHALKSALKLHRLRRESARARGDLWTMARRLTHDMRTPIGCIVTSTDAVQEILAEHLGDNEPLFKSIGDSAQEMARLVERVSLVAKASADAMPRERVDMGAVFGLVRDRLQASAAKRRATFSEPEQWPDVRGVSLWLETIWSDLIGNAIEYGGAAPKIEIGWRAEEKEARFWVRDHGPGVAPELLDRIFQPFHLLHELNAVQGLGLAIVRRLVELQGGRVSYEPAFGGGAYFDFTVPLAGSRTSRSRDGAPSAVTQSEKHSPVGDDTDDAPASDPDTGAAARRAYGS
jgi:signal transduction histidine kinase